MSLTVTMTRLRSLLPLLLPLLPLGCGPQAPIEEVAEREDAPFVAAAHGAAAWTPGAPAGPVIPDRQLRRLGGALGGPPIWKSNNPEVIEGDGWLMQSARADAVRGGRPTPLSGKPHLYLFHINKSGAPRYLHVLVSNPRTQDLRYGAVGSLYTGAERPLGGAGTGPNYAVARDFLDGTFRTRRSGVTVRPRTATELVRAALGPGVMVDGRFELDIEGGGAAYVYTVVTSSGDLRDAINASQGAPARGPIYPPGPDRYGREAGVYATSAFSGTTEIELPRGAAHLGLALNTSSKFDPQLQDHTAPALMTLGDSAPRTYANYGHRYDVTLRLLNPGTAARRVRLSLASSARNPALSMTFNAPVLVDGARIDVLTTPAAPRQELRTVTVAAGASRDLRLALYVPGLITIGQQLVLEAL